MSDIAPQELSDLVANIPSDCEGQRATLAYSGPVADLVHQLQQRCDALEARIVELENQPETPQRVEAGRMAVDTRPLPAGLSGHEVAEIVRAARGGS